MSEAEPMLLDLHETAVALRVSERTVERHVRAGDLSAVRIGSRVLFDPADLRAFIARHKTGGGAMSSRMASNTTRNWASYFFSSSSSRRARPACADSICRRRTKARIISILTLTARRLLRTLDSMATPCSVKARGNLRVPPQLDVPVWNFKFANSLRLRLNMKSSGKRSWFRVTALFRFPVLTPYILDRSLSRMTLWPRMKRMLRSMRPAGTRDFCSGNASAGMFLCLSLWRMASLLACPGSSLGLWRHVAYSLPLARAPATDLIRASAIHQSSACRAGGCGIEFTPRSHLSTIHRSADPPPGHL